MQYTLRNIPPELDAALRGRAREEGKSLNRVALEALGRALGVGAGRPIQRDLAAIAGSWIADRETLEALEAQRAIDPALWP